MSDPVNPKIQFQIRYERQTVKFSSRKEKPFVKVFSAFAERYGMDPNTLRFYLNDRRIRAEETPESVGLEDGEEIDATLMQQGGASRTTSVHSGQ